MQANQLTGLILAGGRSSRMGADKAQLKLGQLSLVERSVRAQSERVSEVLVIGAQPQPFSDPELDLFVAWIEEPVPFQGPVAAIALALNSLTTDWVLVLPCDLVAPDRVAVHLLAEAASVISAETVEKIDAVIARDADGQTQWLTGLFHVPTLRSKLAQLESTDVSVRTALTGLNLRFVSPPEDQPVIWEDMDTPEDFRRVLEELS
jgi:molybdopterin-guanine dinucleotide biosynthesis protein A